MLASMQASSASTAKTVRRVERAARATGHAPRRTQASMRFEAGHVSGDCALLMPSYPSVSQNQIGQYRVIRAVPLAIQILEAVAGQQRSAGQTEHDVLCEKRPVDPRHRRIGADAARDRRLIARDFEHRGLVEPELIEVGRYAQGRSQIEIRTDADQA